MYTGAARYRYCWWKHEISFSWTTGGKQGQTVSRTSAAAVLGANDPAASSNRTVNPASGAIRAHVSCHSGCWSLCMSLGDSENEVRRSKHRDLCPGRFREVMLATTLCWLKLDLHTYSWLIRWLQTASQLVQPLPLCQGWLLDWKLWIKPCRHQKC